MTKTLIFDSSAIITFALNDLNPAMEKLKQKFNGNFFISQEVEKETILRSIGIPRFMLEALKIKKLINLGILEKYDGNIKKETEKILDIANHTFKARGEWITIIHSGEASCIAIYNLINDEDKALIIDERTTRLLCESPENLRNILETKLHTKVESIVDNYNFFKNINIIRSCELMFLAYDYGFIDLPANRKDSIKALMYSAKYNGCSISNKEIQEAMLL
jgi:hypothetical protein